MREIQIMKFKIIEGLVCIRDEWLSKVAAWSERGGANTTMRRHIRRFVYRYASLRQY